MNNIKYSYVQSRNEDLSVAAAVGDNPTIGQLQLTINGNNNYKRLVGVMLIITDSDGLPYTKAALVSIATTSGVVILSEQPYFCIRPSFNERPADRIIPVENVNGFGHDFRFQVSIENKTDTVQEFTISAVAYFQ